MEMVKELRTIFDAELKSQLARGASADEAERMAYRAAQHAGWYETVDGWKRIAPDLREKINVRKAMKQGDGTYLIQDVDVFYPNAVKGANGQIAAYDAEDVQNRIHNSSLAVSSGGIVPLTPTHIRPEHKFTGVTIPAIGKCINWRQSPRGEGWARCDIADVNQDTIDSWKMGRITGFSAGLTEDTGGTNKRFGHVAALGGEPQALSRLPRTEIYAADDITSFPGQLCFSADAGTVSTGATMPKNHSKLAPHFSALTAAFAAMDAGEPGADEKFKQANEGYCSAMKEYSGVDAPAGEPTVEHNGGEEEEEANPAAEAAIDKAADKGEGEEEPFSATLDEAAQNFSADPAGAFGKMIGVLKPMAKRVAVLTKENHSLRQQTARSQFGEFIAGLAKAGHTFSADDAMATFDAAGGNQAMIAALKKMLQGTPKAPPSLADAGDVFSADEAATKAPTKPGSSAPAVDPKKAKTVKAEVQKRAREVREDMGTMNFSGDGPDVFYDAVNIGDAVTALDPAMK